MAVLPAGFALPPWPYVVVLAVGVAIVGGTLWRLAPSVTAATVLGLVPWMAVGSALHAWFVIGAAPASLTPLFGTPAVYAFVFIVLGAVWAGLSARGELDPGAVARWLAAGGSLGFAIAAALVLSSGTPLSLFWPVVGLVVALLIGALTWALLRAFVPAAAVTSWAGVLVVVAHALDGVSTAIGVDVLGFGERTPASRFILDLAAGLPSADLVGVGWLFVLVKLGLAGAIVAVFADLVEEDPRQGHLLLALIAAVGLGPGVHNLLLYAVAG